MRRTVALFAALAVLLSFLALSGSNKTGSNRATQIEPDAPKTDSIRAAALYAGMVTGMGIVCKLDTEPVMQSYTAFLKNHSEALIAEDQQDLLNLNAEGLGTGMRMQKERGAIPCSEVRSRMREAIDKLHGAGRPLTTSGISSASAAPRLNVSLVAHPRQYSGILPYRAP